MSNWQVGDLAVCVDAHDNPAFRPTEVREGMVYRVTRVINRPTSAPNWPGLHLSGVKCDCANGFDHRRFRKILPDKHEQCEPEFVTLLKRIKRTAPAETASDWLLRAGPIAKELNEQSRKDQ